MPHRQAADLEALADLCTPWCVRVAATLRIAEGAHTLILKSAHHSDWSRSISILKDSTVTVKATFDPN